MIYMKQLDGLRGLAVLSVLYHHFFVNIAKPLPWFQRYPNFAEMGVDLFFVISGFLITAILLKCREDIESGSISLADGLKTFWVRRTLRIFPIYYLTLAVTYLFAIAPVRESLPWHLCYLSNFYFARIGDWHGPISHFWSLAVEEQFYLLWPLLILVTPSKYLFKFIVCVIVVGPIFRHICTILGTSWMLPGVMVAGSLDLLGMGALLAYLARYHDMESDRAIQNFLKICLLVGGVLSLDKLLLEMFGLPNSLIILSKTFNGMFFCYIIWRVSIRKTGFFGYILESKPLVMVGKISYGIYVYHNFVPTFLARTPVWSAINEMGGRSPIPLFLIFASCSICIATLSWWVIERPLLVVKEKVAAHSKKQRKALAASAY